MPEGAAGPAALTSLRGSDRLGPVPTTTGGFMSSDSTQAPAGEVQICSLNEVPADTRRGGDVRTLLSPKSVGSTSGFMGVATLAPGDRISEHYHPYSEEFVYVISGELDAQLDGKSHVVKSRQGLMIPINVRHRLV